jgi:hypothetical protein
VPGRDDFPRAGYPNGDSHEMPADLAAVQADDALLDMIGRTGYHPHDDHDELTRVLAGWRQEMEAEPFRELVDTDTAVAAIRAGRRPVRRRNPVFGSIAAAAAVLVIAFSSVGLVAKSAQPGDRLWGVTQVLYGDYARSVETAATVRTELNEARTALKQGDPERARASLQRVQNQLPAISESEGRNDLTASHRQLEQILNKSPETGSATMPGMPGFPSSGSRSSTSSGSTDPSTSTDPATTSDPGSELSSSMTPPVITKDHHPGPDFRRPGHPGPSGGPSSVGTTTGDRTGGVGATGDGPAAEGTTVGKDFSRRGNATGTPGNDAPNVGPSQPSKDHLHSGGPGGGAAPGCGLTGPGRPPYCG